MPENDFEKQVQQKMEELRFNPSDTTWTKVEKQIADDKKRRRILLWIPLLFLLMAGAAWIFFSGSKDNHSTGTAIVKNYVADKRETAPKQASDDRPDSLSRIRNKKETAQHHSIKNNEPTPADDNNVSSDLKEVHNDEGSKHGQQYTSAAKKNIALMSITNTGKNKTNIPARFSGLKNKENTTASNRSGKKYQKNTTGIAGTMQAENAGQEVYTSAEKKTVDSDGKKQSTSAIAAPGNDSATVNDKVVPVTTDSNTTAIASKKSPENKQAIKNADSVQEKTTTAAKHPRNLEWGITAGIGSSGITSGFPIPFALGTQSLYYASSPNTSTGNSSINNPGYTTPSSIHSNVSWNIGVFVSKPLSQTFRVSAGLHYSQYATNMEVGSRIDSNATTVYRNDRSSTYTNRSHFIELPLLAEQQFGPKSRFSVQAGLSFGILLSANTLLYNPQKNIYYTDKSQVSSTQWNLLAGFNYRLLQKKTRLELGPRFSYAPGHNFKRDMNGYGHWYLVGAQAKIFLGRLK